jgi:hypothetical protein
MTANLPVSRLVNVGLVITPQAIQAPALNTGLVLGTSTVIDTVTRMREYATLNAVAVDFGTNSQEFLAAVPWFGQSPQPTSLNIGRWCNTAAAGQLVCGPLPASSLLIGTWTAINNGAFGLAVDGGPSSQVTGLNFSNVVTIQGVAAIIQTAVRLLGGSYAAVTVTFNSVSANFTFTSGTTGASSSVNFLTAGGTGTDISALLAGLAIDGAFVAPGVAAESALAAVVLFDNKFAGQWYNLFIPSSVDSDDIAIAPFIDGGNNPHFYWINTQEPAVLAAGDTTHIGFLLQQLESQHTAWQYSSTSLYAVWSMAARIATTNYAGNNTCISLMYKTEPGIAPESLTDTQANAIDGYNGNVFVSYQFGSSTAIIEQGICPSGQFIDTIIGSDALRLQVQANIFNLLAGTPTKIPQTDAGVALLENGCDSAGAQFVLNGFLAPGVWTGNSFGQLTEGQWLDKGYYTFAQPIAQQTEAQRTARISPPIQMAAKCAGAIDTVAVTIFVND